MRCTSCQGHIRPVVALDVDGTMARYHEAMEAFMAMYLPSPPTFHSREKYDGVGEFRDWFGLDERTYSDAKLAFRSGGFKRWMPAFPYASSLTADLKAAGCEVWITTTRPWLRMDNMDPDTREWLRRNRIHYDYLMFDEDKYGTLADLVGKDRIVAILEDQEDQLERCAQLGLPAIFRKTIYNRAIHHEPSVVSLKHARDTILERVEQWRVQHA